MPGWLGGVTGGTVTGGVEPGCDVGVVTGGTEPGTDPCGVDTGGVDAGGAPAPCAPPAVEGLHADGSTAGAG